MRRIVIVLALAQVALPSAWGWGAPVHRTITYLALEGLPSEAPAWLRDPVACERAAFQSNQPDRWRGWNSLVLQHENDPEHFLDVDDLAQFGLTLDSLPKLRREYVRVLVIAKHAHPESIASYDADKDPARAHEWPGFVLHAVAERYAKLQAAFNQVRILEKVNEPARQQQLEQARAIAICELGELSHFVGDIGQPLHTTKHYNGWVGENPAGYKWRNRFHAYIDEGFADRHDLTRPALRGSIKYGAHVDANDPWADVVALLRRSNAQLEPLYVLERDGKLDGAEGEKLLVEQLSDCTSTLSALIWAAYTSAAPTEKQVESWIRYDHSAADPQANRSAATQATASTQPAP